MATAASKTYYVGPQDGWVEIVDGTTTAIAMLRISAVPYTQPFRVYVGSSAPSITEPGILNCHHPFKVADFTTAGISAKFYVKVTNRVNSSNNADGRLRLDVYADGGVLQ